MEILKKYIMIILDLFLTKNQPIMYLILSWTEKVSFWLISIEIMNFLIISQIVAKNNTDPQYIIQVSIIISGFTSYKFLDKSIGNLRSKVPNHMFSTLF